MLAGNVAAVVAGGNLTLTGDEADNSVEVTVVDGDLVVRGLDGTTINGSANPFVAVDNMTTLTGDFQARLGAGTDTLRITGPLTITGDTDVRDTSGATQVGITDATLTGAVQIVTGNADDAVSIAGAMLQDDLTINVGGGDDLVSVFETTVTGDVAIFAEGKLHRLHGLRERLLARHERRSGRLYDRLHHRHGSGEDPFADDDIRGRLEELFGRLKLGGLNGDDSIVIEDSTAGSFRFYTGNGADNVVVQDSTVNGNVRGNTGSGNDFVMVDGATVTGNTSLLLERGDDKLVAENTNSFTGDVYANGGSKHGDAAQVSDESTVGGELKLRRFESSTVSDDMIAMRGTDTLAAASELRTDLNGLEDGNGNNNTDPPALTLDTSMNDDSMQSNGTLVTTQTMFTIEGQTAPGAAIDVAGGPGGAVDLGSTTADMDGHFSIDVTLLEGGTTIQVTSMTEGGSTTEDFNLYRAVGTVVRFTNSEGTFDVELLDDDAPITVANFLSYFDEYVNSFIHRAGNGTGGVPSVVQGGGFFLDGADIEPIATSAPIANEFNAMNSNLAGTLSMALSGDGFGGTNPNSGTSQWFFNLVDNIFLNANQHTVFGRIIGTGLSILQAIQALPRFDITASVESTPVGGFDPTDALTDVPLDGYDDFSQALPGTVSIPANSIIVTGTGTNFTSTLEPGELIQIGGVTRAVLEVNSDTMLTLTSAPATAVTGATVFVNPIPTADELVLFSSIAVILPAP